MPASFASEDDLKLDDVIHDVGDAVCVTDGKMVFKGANQRFADFYGLPSPAILMGKSAFAIYPEFRKSVFYDMCESTIRTGETATRMGRSMNTGLDIVMRCYKSKAYDDRYVMVVHSMSEGTAKADYSTNVDSLTSLPNRWKFEQDVMVLRSHGENTMGLILVDITHFKSINERLGVEVGDRCLMEVAARIKLAVSASDRVYRQGDDRFLVLCTPDQLDERRSSINLSLARPFDLGTTSYGLQVRMALHRTQHPESPAEAMTKLEQALSWTKDNKQPFAEYNPTMGASGFDPTLTKELDDAIINDELELYFQPQVDLIDGQAIGAEVLVRWQHPARGLLTPDKFLPFAEDTGRIREVDELITRKTIAYQADLRRRGIFLQLSVNLSSLSVCNPSLPGKIAGWLAEHGVPASTLCMEITETAMMNNVTTSREVIERIKALGVEISLDDFGTGYSSMQYLLRYRANTLKIDRSFVRDLVADEASRTAVENMINLAHGLKILVVAEGVETEDELDLLRLFKCDIVQGYLYAKPQPQAPFEAWLAKAGVGQVGSIVR